MKATIVCEIFYFFRLFFSKYLEITYSKFFYFLYFLIPLKVGLSPSKNNCVICFIESPLKIMKNAFYFILKALFIFKICKFFL